MQRKHQCHGTGFISLEHALAGTLSALLIAVISLLAGPFSTQGSRWGGFESSRTQTSSLCDSTQASLVAMPQGSQGTLYIYLDCHIPSLCCNYMFIYVSSSRLQAPEGTLPYSLLASQCPAEFGRVGSLLNAY